MANPESDRAGGHKAMLVVYYTTPSTHAVAGIESVYALEKGHALNGLQFVKKDAVFDTAAKAYSHFLANKPTVAKDVQVGGKDIHSPYPRLNSKDSWESRYRIKPKKDAKLGFPKGGEKNKDNGNPLITAIREFKEEIGVEIPPDVVTGYNSIRKVDVYFADVTGPSHDALRKEIDAALKSYAEKSELFDSDWINIARTDPKDLNSISEQVHDYLTDLTKIKPVDPKEIADAKRILAPAPAPAAASSRPAKSEEEARAYLEKKLKETGERKYQFMIDAVGKNWANVQIYDGGRKTRRIGRNKLDTKKLHIRNLSRKTRRTP